MKITSKKELRDCLEIEKTLYFKNDGKMFARFLLNEHDYQIWKYQKSIRMFEYHFNCGHKIRYLLWNLRCNNLSSRLGIYMHKNCVDTGLRIWHYGSIIINGNAKIGKYCQLHGCNCIGNKGVASSEAPVIGDNVDIGVGAVIIGNVYIADNVRIGANAVVTKSCYEKGAVLVGNPARPMKSNGTSICDHIDTQS